MRLTEAQKRCLKSVGDGIVQMHFDVHLGYQWQEKTFVTGWRMSELLAPAPIQRLYARKFIEVAKTDRPYPGRLVHTYGLTPAGRAILDQERGEG